MLAGEDVEHSEGESGRARSNKDRVEHVELLLLLGIGRNVIRAQPLDFDLHQAAGYKLRFRSKK